MEESSSLKMHLYSNVKCTAVKDVLKRDLIETTMRMRPKNSEKIKIYEFYSSTEKM
jgi:hypothetical protein